MKGLELFAVFLVLSLVHELHCLPSVFKFDQRAFSGQQHETRRKTDTAQAPPTCGYQGCTLGKPDMLNVHLVPHTHDDVGWLKTVDQYYYGAHSEIQNAGVQYILDTVITNLEQNPDRRFIYVEIAFFHRWWDEQNEERREAVRRLVNEGRLEFILGGWCMNDEAATHYNAIIDQHTLGFRFLRENFGECAVPHIGWQIDPFGHSREQASLFAQFGFDGLFFGRLDYQDKDKRLKDKTMEMMWMGSDSLGEQASLLTGVLFNGYNPPPGWCIDTHCIPQDPPIMDDPRLEDYNVDQRVADFLKAAKNQAKNYSTNHIMMTMGSDFQYENAHINFKNLDKLVKYVNQMQERSNSKVNVFYSTPGCYLYALNQANQTYTTKSDDFFPYANRANTFWTGYFTSRPAVKGYVRKCNNFLQVCNQLGVLAEFGAEFETFRRIDNFRRAMGVSQHHDAVSGTEKQAVADDYAKRLAKGEKNCQEVVNEALARLMTKPGVHAGATLEFCQLNVSRCDTSENNNNFTMVVYNPLGHESHHRVRVPVTDGSYTVKDSSMNVLESDLVPLSDATKNLPNHNGSKATHELVFRVPVPPVGFETVFVQSSAAVRPQNRFRESNFIKVTADDVQIKNEIYTLTFDGSSGLLKSIDNTESNISTPMKQSLLYYKGFIGNNSKDVFQSSGAYVFRPNGSEPLPVATDNVKLTVNRMAHVEEVVQEFSDWATQVVRLHKGSRDVEIEWTVGPIPIKDGIGKEVISRFDTDLATNKIFYTDANGREVLKRVRDYRPTWTLNQTEKVAGNYFPVNSRIFIKDETKKTQLTVLTDRSQGGASIKDGSVEVMVHRRLLHDDSFGVGEPLNETGITGKGLVVRGKQRVIFETMDKSVELQRQLGLRTYMEPSVMFSASGLTAEEYAKNYNVKWSALSRPLPANVHMLTLAQWGPESYILRLEHFYEKNEHPVLSKPATVNLKGLFTTFEVLQLDELTLGANQRLVEAKRLRWNTKGQGTTNGDMSSFVTPVDPATMAVVLQPMQIRTFEMRIRRN